MKRKHCRGSFLDMIDPLCKRWQKWLLGLKSVQMPLDIRTTELVSRGGQWLSGGYMTGGFGRGS